MNYKKWLITFFTIIIIFFLLSSIIVYIIDPYFHYHKPLDFLAYNFSNRERYINNGIVKNFDYDAMIIGTSHNENFKTSEFDSLFNCNSIKVPLSGGEYKEIADQTAIAINHNKNIKYILYGINYSDMLNDKDIKKYDNYPTYLYDENIFNDYKYLFSGEVLKLSISSITNSLANNKTTTFDNYVNWGKRAKLGKDHILEKYKRESNKIVSTPLTEEEKKTLEENITQNITNVINLNKNITYYLFLSPYSIVWWDSVSQNGKIIKYLEAEEILIDTLLEFDNVKLYSYFNNYELICNLDIYRDSTHYSEDINSQILNWIKKDEYLITKENKDTYLAKERNFYLNYDYDKIFVDN